jgi:hypothetical protein
MFSGLVQPALGYRPKMPVGLACRNSEGVGHEGQRGLVDPSLRWPFRQASLDGTLVSSGRRDGGSQTWGGLSDENGSGRGCR